ncbi:MAG TPA: TRAFs-binding domain-containing protein [Chthoniobacterales bacterium]
MEVFRLLGEKLLKRGEPLLAYDVVRQGLEEFPRDVRLRQLQGLALARSGSSERAGAILSELVKEKHADSETLGMLARTYKDRALRAATPREARGFWRRAAEIYAQAHAASGDYWTGINAATTALLIGRETRALHLAKKIRAICRRELQRETGDRYWLLATLGEAALILRDWPLAHKRYAEARGVAGRRFGNLQASRRNAELLLNHWQVDLREVEESLRVPPITVFAGHMLDGKERARPRFPARDEAAVAAAIQARVAKIGAIAGYASAACGSDILFFEAMLAAGAEIHVVLPCAEKEFAGRSVQSGGAGWLERFHRVLEKATRVLVASAQQLVPGAVSYDYTNQLTLGLARIRAAQLETEVIPLAVWDKLPGDGPGGTASAIARWRKAGLPIELIDLTAMRSPNERKVRRSAPRRSRLTESKTARPEFEAQIRAMLFADAVSFSKLTEDALPQFVRHFLGAVSRQIDRARRGILFKNSWGDGLYLVFRDVRGAGNFALDLAEEITGQNWAAAGLPATLNLRIGVHAGPVLACIDPIKRARDFFGAHVSRTARIEPITPPGQVYASEAFTALAAAQQVADLAFEYAGQVPMAKGREIYPMYHMTRARP